MQSRWWRLFSVVLILSLLMPMVALAAPSDPFTDEPLATVQSSGSKRFIVQLEGDPLAKYYRKMGAPLSMSRAAGKLDATSPEAQAYINALRAKQWEVFQAIERAVPGTRMAQYMDERGRLRPLMYQVVFNGFVIELPRADRETFIKLSRIPGIKSITVERQIELNMEIVNPLIGAPGVWDALGGVDAAGEGVKVAVIDTGIDPNHPGLDPTGYRYPVGFPKGDTRYTTPKVIVMRGYFRPNDPPVAPFPLPAHPHGTGVATIIATNPNTVATYEDVDVPISGVAPKAYLMSYQIFYPSASGSSARFASEPEAIRAVEDMVMDGADVVNNSWGTSVFTPLKRGFNPLIDALEAAVAAGVVVVKSAGNSGPGPATVGGNDQPVSGISVGATLNTRAFGNELQVVAPEPVPEELQSVLAVPATFGGELTEDLAPTSVVWVGRIDEDNAVACNPIDDPNGELVGKVALIIRGQCRFDRKVTNAQEAGAIGVIIFNNVPAAPPFAMGGETDGITIWAFMIGNLQGRALAQLEADNPGQVQITLSTQTSYITDIVAPDVLTNFSSRGPAYPLDRIVPDIVAPGQNVLSGYGLTSVPEKGLWAPWQGTSASAPIVAGAAALLKQRYPDWTPDMIKSALMTTATPQVWLDFQQTIMGNPMDVGAGRVQVDKAINPGAVVRVYHEGSDMPPNVSAMFGQVMPGETKVLTMEFQSVIGIDATWTLTVQDPFNVGLSLSSETVPVPAMGTGSVELILNVPEDMEPGDYWGHIIFTHGPHWGHIPFWVRVEAPKGDAEVLLIDDDGSFLQPIVFGVETPDYRPYYEAMLDNLGISYDVWDAEQMWLQTGRGLPDIATLQQYETVIWFTGDSFLTYFGVTAGDADRTRLLDWLHNSPGSRLLVTGQDWSGYFDDFINGADSGCVLCSLGVGRWAEDAYSPAALAESPFPSAVGEGPFADMVIDLGAVMTPTLESGAGNQAYVDGLYPDGPFAPEWTGFGTFRALMPASEASSSAVPYMATGRGAEPRLEWFLMGDPEGTTTSSGRALFFAFGLEGINNEYAEEMGFATREDVLGRALEWLGEEVSITVTGTLEVTAPEPVVLTATLTSSLPYTQPITFRWWWGDGTGILSSGTSPTAAHVYDEPGTYTVYVEGTSPMGHSAITSIEVTVQPNPVEPVTWITETVTLEPIADTYIDAWAVPWIPPAVGSGPNLKVRAKDIRTALLAFDLSGLPEDAEILSADLQLYATFVRGTVNIGAYNVLRPWSEANASWWEADVGEKWEQPGANGAADRAAMPTDVQTVSAGGWVTFDVTSAAQAWFMGEGYGIALRGDEVLTPFGGEVDFISREFTTLRPQLTVTYRYPSPGP